MKTLYCDGSLHKAYEVIGIGIVYDDHKEYVQLKYSNWNEQSHEVEALIHTIELGLSKGFKKFRVINDDKILIESTNKRLRNEKVKSKGMLKKERYKYLLKLIKDNNLKLDLPAQQKDKPYIKMCHDLSRSYLGDGKTVKRKNRTSRLNLGNFKHPEKLFIGHVNKLNVSSIEKDAMMNYYKLFVGGHGKLKYKVEDMLEWISDKPSLNTKNGRKLIVRQFVEEFHGLVL